jgi:hypothetical protein
MKYNDVNEVRRDVAAVSELVRERIRLFEMLDSDPFDALADTCKDYLEAVLDDEGNLRERDAMDRRRIVADCFLMHKLIEGFGKWSVGDALGPGDFGTEKPKGDQE